MEERDSKLRRVELKICERCGGLWLRPAGSAWAYCGPCKGKVDELPAVRNKQSRRKQSRRGVPALERVS